MHLKIITHKEILFDEDVNEIYARGIDGEFGVLKDHEPIMSALDIGVTKIVQDNGTKLFTIACTIYPTKQAVMVLLYSFFIFFPPFMELYRNKLSLSLHKTVLLWYNIPK